MLTTELAGLGIQDPHNPADWIAKPDSETGGEPDPNDVADRTEDWDERRATVALLETRFNNITRALNKFNTGTYGVCEISGEPIEADRLAANPAARTCKKHLEAESDLPA
ncbi:TraR/DksA C4-type zinc finger protein [Candidatus Kaiserbacteria bacterium]|nr:TraR/DksA C4-type zinc finger protein [Candidatus Kaiserbacteria bacterium]MCB9811495.1 TraR/DksA C4-type zinc finger protein [Candidatus Nomurabacteria bacterium]